MTPIENEFNQVLKANLWRIDCCYNCANGTPGPDVTMNYCCILKHNELSWTDKCDNYERKR